MIDLFATPPSTDIAWAWANAIMPDDLSSPYGQALAIFASALTYFAVGFLGFMTLNGIVQTAYSGKVLGERWHQIFTPLRVILGLGLLVPIAASYSPAHHMIKQAIIRPSINLANSVWVGFVHNVAEKGTPIIPISSGGSGLVIDIAEHEICASVANAAGNRWGWRTQLPTGTGKVTNGRIFWDYGTDCGQLSFSIPENRENFTAARRQAVAAIIDEIRPIAEAYGAAFAQGQNPASTPETAMSAVDTGVLPANVYQTIQQAGQAYDTTIAEAARVEATGLDSDARSKLVEAAKQQGFVNAGSYWRSLAQISQLTSSLAGEKAENTVPRWGRMAGFEREIKTALAGLKNQISGEQIEVNLTAADLAAAGDENADFLTKVLGPMTRNLSEWLTSYDPDSDPMGSMISSGQTMIDAAGTGITAGAVVMVGASNWFSEKLGANGAAQWLLGYAKLGIGALWIIGVMWAYILPMLPFLYVITAAITWASAIIESMIAVLIWSISWLRQDDGDFVAQGQQAGLKLLFNLALRPVLAILSLIASYVVLQVALGTVQKLWAAAFFGMTGGSVSGLSGLIVSLALLTYIQWWLCLRVFGLIASLPDRVADWMGVSTSGRMDESGHMTAAVAGAVAIPQRANATSGIMRPQSGKSGSGGGNDKGIASATNSVRQPIAVKRDGNRA